LKAANGVKINNIETKLPLPNKTSLNPAGLLSNKPLETLGVDSRDELVVGVFKA
jgi:hypothetical protein